MTRPRGVSASPPPALFPARRRLPPRSGKRSEAGPALSPGRAAESRRPPPGREEGRNGAWRSVGKFVPRCTPYPPERSVPRWLRKRSSRGVHLLRGGGGGGPRKERWRRRLHGAGASGAQHHHRHLHPGRPSPAAREALTDRPGSRTPFPSPPAPRPPTPGPLPPPCSRS